MTIMNNTKEESKKGNKRNRKELVGEPEYWYVTEVKKKFQKEVTHKEFLNIL